LINKAVKYIYSGQYKASRDLVTAFQQTLRLGCENKKDSTSHFVDSVPRGNFLSVVLSIVCFTILSSLISSYLAGVTLNNASG